LAAGLVESLAPTEALAEVFSVPCDLKQLLLQTAIDARGPAANTAFPIGQKELEDAGLEPPNEAKK
jgi:hypothetical protein